MVPYPLLSICFPIADTGPVLLVLLEMCVCSSLSSSPHHGTETPQPTPRNRWELGHRQALGQRPPWDLRKEDLHQGFPAGLWEAPQDLCFAGPPCASSRLHVLCLVQCALLCDSPAPIIGHVGPSGRGCPRGIRHCQHPPSRQDTMCKALGKEECGGREGTSLGGVGPGL